MSPHPGGLEVLLNVFPHDTKMEHALFGCHGFGVMTISDVLSLAATRLCACNLRFVMNCNTIVDRQEDHHFVKCHHFTNSPHPSCQGT